MDGQVIRYRPRVLAIRVAALLGFALAFLGACASSPVSQPVATGSAVPTTTDLQWLERVSLGLDSASLGELRHLGRERYLAQQLSPGPDAIPAPIVGAIESLEVEHVDAATQLVAVRRERARIQDLKDGTAQEVARKALNEHGRQLSYEATERLLLESIYSRNGLQEQMVWFWLNHFSVHESKSNLRWLVADYERRAIRPHALGHFRDLVMATLTHPAMLEYLDNAQNAVGHINENYARELMELHTLGIDGGYTQTDVQELARVLTGVGLWGGNERPRIRREWQALYRREGAMEFHPGRHDFGPKTLLGRPLTERGFAEVEQAVDRLVRSPACASFIARKLAVYFVSDQPPATLVARLAKTFQRTDGDIRAVLHELLLSPELQASLGTKFRDPYHYVIGAVRFAYDGQPISNVRPIVNWLNTLGEAYFGHQTPDGYPLNETGWASSGQLEKRFEIARAIGNGTTKLFEPEQGAAPPSAGFPRLASRLYYDAVEPRLAPATKSALGQAASQQEWNTLLLASPEFNYR